MREAVFDGMPRREIEHVGIFFSLREPASLTLSSGSTETSHNQDFGFSIC
jgi:hypothetical protein